jgi:hypothetical protein
MAGTCSRKNARARSATHGSLIRQPCSQRGANSASHPHSAVYAVGRELRLPELS